MEPSQNLEARRGSATNASVLKSTETDKGDMWRLGKQQELQRNFGWLTMFGFAMVLMAAWEFSLAVASIALANGGTAGYIWMFVSIWIGFLIINTSLAELGSMAPTSGGQYHWVSEFASRRHQRAVSYCMGWMVTLGWAGAANTALLCALQVQGLVVLNYDEYEPRRWHSTLMTLGIGAFSLVCNTVLAKRLPLMESCVLWLHVVGFIAVIVVLWTMATEKTPAVEVFTHFYDGDWSNAGVSTMIGGTLASILPLLGADGAVHLSEELRDAAKIIPWTMITSTLVNGIMALTVIITFCFCMGDLSTALQSPTGFTFIEVFHYATGSRMGATMLAIPVVIVNIFCTMSIVTTASRQLYAFARDDGVPCAKWLARVPPGWGVPINAVLLTSGMTLLLSLINIGSDVAFNSISSLSLCAILGSYIVCISLVVWRRFTGRPLLRAPFALGRWGLPVNVVSLCFLVFAFFWSFWPPVPHPRSSQMNWNIVMFAGTALLSLAYFIWHGRKKYKGPVAYVRRTADEMDRLETPRIAGFDTEVGKCNWAYAKDEMVGDGGKFATFAFETNRSGEKLSAGLEGWMTGGNCAKKRGHQRSCTV